MNTRLQVEHPVTELVTGLDLVEEMIRIAAGEQLRLRQEDVRFDRLGDRGAHLRRGSVSAASCPRSGACRATGRRRRGRATAATIRIDSGVVEGSEISIFYDPMIAKLCTHAPSRDAAIDAMADALDAFAIDGIRHNIPFLSALMAHPRWREGRLSTGFIAEEYPDGFHGAAPSGKERAILAAIAATAELAERARLAQAGRGSRPSAADRHEWVSDARR